MGATFPNDERLYLDARALSGACVRGHGERVIPFHADLRPVTAVKVRDGALGGCALYITRFGDGGSGLAAPPEFTWELRATFGDCSIAIPGAAGTITPASFEVTGDLVHVGGRLAQGFELWARTTAGGDLKAWVQWYVAPSAVGAFDVKLGSFV